MSVLSGRTRLRVYLAAVTDYSVFMMTQRYCVRIYVVRQDTTACLRPSVQKNTRWAVCVQGWQWGKGRGEGGGMAEAERVTGGWERSLGTGVGLERQTRYCECVHNPDQNVRPTLKFLLLCFQDMFQNGPITIQLQAAALPATPFFQTSGQSPTPFPLHTPLPLQVCLQYVVCNIFPTQP